MSRHHRSVVHVCVGGPLDGQLLAMKADRERYEMPLMLPTQSAVPYEIEVPADADLKVDRMTYVLRRCPGEKWGWLAPEGMSDSEALSLLLADPGALKAALLAYAGADSNILWVP